MADKKETIMPDADIHVTRDEAIAALTLNIERKARSVRDYRDAARAAHAIIGDQTYSEAVRALYRLVARQFDNEAHKLHAEVGKMRERIETLRFHASAAERADERMESEVETVT